MLSIIAISTAISKQNVAQTKRFENSFLQFQLIAEHLHLGLPQLPHLLSQIPFISLTKTNSSDFPNSVKEATNLMVTQT